MDPASSSDPLIDLARRISDGRQIDWDALARTTSSVDPSLLRRLQRVSRIVQAQREIRAADPLANLLRESPRQIADYRIRRQIGAGGLGVVYEAEQRHPRRAVALKVIRGSHAANEHAIRWFQREARTLALLKHPSIASIFASGQADSGEHFIAMELVRGKTLADWLQSRAVAPADSKDELQLRLAVFRRICEAVAYAHRRGVIHRDLKPSNILVTSDSDDPHGVPGIKILDFGLAHAAFATVITEIGRVQGTLRYMSPEQILGDADEIDTRTDIYSLGIILYELVTGTLPYEIGGGSLREKAQTVCETAPRPWTEVWTGSAVPRDLESIARKALEKSPGARPPTVHALIEELDRFSAEDSQPKSTSVWGRRVLGRPFSRVLGLAVLIALMAYAAFVSVLLVRGRGEPAGSHETVPPPGSPKDAP